MSNKIIYAPIVISGVVTKDQRFGVFQIQINEAKKNTVLVDEKVEGIKLKNNSWTNVPYVFKEAEKGKKYQVRIRIHSIDGDHSRWSNWQLITAGDNEFGTTTWNNSCTSTDHSLIVAVQLQNPPIDFQRVELYERDSDETEGSEHWKPDYIYTKTEFTHFWTGDRSTTKYFFTRAYDISGNHSELSTEVHGQINIILPGDMDTVPPENSIAELILTEFE
jgi:hypothetical protein